MTDLDADTARDNVALVVEYPNDMDPECVALCDFINSCRGLRTFESCCGHGNGPFRVFLTAHSLGDLQALVEPLSTDSAWRLTVDWANGGGLLYFFLEGPIDVSSGDDFAARLKGPKIS